MTFTFILYTTINVVGEEMATDSNILAWEMPWTEEPGGLSPWGFKSPTRLSD